jgi:hypothetical protein
MMRYMQLLLVILRIISGRYRRQLTLMVKEMVNDVDGDIMWILPRMLC